MREIAISWTKLFAAENILKLLSFCSSFLASSDFCGLLKTFANSLDPDQDRQNVGPDLDPNCLTLL